MKTFINYGRGNIFSFDAAPVVKKETKEIDMGKTIEHIKSVVGKEAAIEIAPNTYAYA